MRWSCIALLAVLCACDSGDTPASTPEPGADNAVPEKPPASDPHARVLVKRKRKLMGTWFEIQVAGAAPGASREAADRALDEIERLEGVLSEWRPETELSRLNAQAGGDPLPLSPDSWNVIQAGLQVSSWSEGAFDLSWAAMRGLYTFQPGEKKVPAQADIERLVKLVDYRKLVVDPKGHTVQLPVAGMSVGTGSIGKGYALDRAGELLQQAGFNNYLLFAGGQVQVHGNKEGRAWRIGIKHPRKPGSNIGFFELNDGSVSTSGDYEHFFMAQGRRWHHIIDVSTGYPATRSAAVTLLAPMGVYADALSTACFVLGPERCLKMIEELPFEAQAVVVDPEMRVQMTPGLQNKVIFRPPLVDGKIAPPS